MESKINIDIRDNIEPGLALLLVARVTDSGKISEGEKGKIPEWRYQNYIKFIEEANKNKQVF